MTAANVNKNRNKNERTTNENIHIKPTLQVWAVVRPLPDQRQIAEDGLNMAFWESSGNGDVTLKSSTKKTKSFTLFSSSKEEEYENYECHVGGVAVRNTDGKDECQNETIERTDGRQSDLSDGRQGQVFDAEEYDESSEDQESQEITDSDHEPGCEDPISSDDDI